MKNPSHLKRQARIDSHWYEVFYSFKMCGTVAMGVEEIYDAESINEAIEIARDMHPHANLHISQVTEWDGKKFRKVRF